ncbi:MAG: hypothetical protein KME06_09375 [Kastovskya adunca ATA6-11-RM4]|nr:hypothetical protein [Kastovskya adunca ATA6-11-RM4]
MTCPFQNPCDDSCSSLAICLAESQKNNSRDRRSRGVVAAQTATDNQQEFTGRYVGFNCTTGNHVCALPSGGKVESASITNGLIQGDRPVTVNIPQGSDRGMMDAMPR